MGHFSLCHVVLHVVKIDDVASTIFEPNEQAGFPIAGCGQVFLADYVAHALRDHTQPTFVAVAALDAASVGEKVVTDEIGLQGVGPVVDLDPELRVKVVHI